MVLGQAAATLWESPLARPVKKEVLLRRHSKPSGCFKHSIQALLQSFCKITSMYTKLHSVSIIFGLGRPFSSLLFYSISVFIFQLLPLTLFECFILFTCWKIYPILFRMIDIHSQQGTIHNLRSLQHFPQPQSAPSLFLFLLKQSQSIRFTRHCFTFITIQLFATTIARFRSLCFIHFLFFQNPKHFQLFYFQLPTSTPRHPVDQSILSLIQTLLLSLFTICFYFQPHGPIYQ